LTIDFLVRSQPIVMVTLPEVDESPALTQHRLSEYINSFSRYVVLSPHLDDAVLSMGSLLTDLVQSGKDVMVANIFTQGSWVDSSLTQRLLQQAQVTSAEEYFAVRQQEDVRALSLLGRLQINNLDYIDAPWRYDQNKTCLYQSVFDPLATEDETLVKRLGGKIAELSRQEDTLVFAPLGRGKHIDHLIVRKAATHHCQSVIYYSDFPYALRHDNEIHYIVTNKLQPVDWRSGDYLRKKDAILAYTSQYTSFLKTQPLPIVHERFYTNALTSDS
jgi:LmbE family N-acetylglucosaminyl deacetylase